MLKFSTTTTIEIKIAVSCDPALDMTPAEISAYLQGDFDSLKVKQDQAPTFFYIKPLSPADREEIEIKAGAYTRSELGRMLFVEQPEDQKKRAYWQDSLSDQEKNALAQYQAYLNRVYAETAKKALIRVEGFDGTAWDAVQSIKPDHHRIQTIAEIVTHIQRISLLGDEGK